MVVSFDYDIRCFFGSFRISKGGFLFIFFLGMGALSFFLDLEFL